MIANTVADGFITVPISSGTPSSLSLPTGDYLLAWQVDTDAGVPSYTPGIAGEGTSIERPFGPFPPDLDYNNPVSASEKWTMYLNYTVLPNTVRDWSIYE